MALSRLGLRIFHLYHNSLHHSSYPYVVVKRLRVSHLLFLLDHNSREAALEKVGRWAVDAAII